MITIPRDTVAIAIDYKGNSKHFTAVRCMPEENKIVPQFQLNCNELSKDFGQWRQIGLFTMATNAQIFIASKTKTAKGLWAVTKDRRFVLLWDASQGVVEAQDVVLEPTVVEVKADENTGA